MTRWHESADPGDSLDEAPRPRQAMTLNPYAVPLATLVAGAYVGVAEQVQLHPGSSFADDVGAGFGLAADADGDGE